MNNLMESYSPKLEPTLLPIIGFVYTYAMFYFISVMRQPSAISIQLPIDLSPAEIA